MKTTTLTEPRDQHDPHASRTMFPRLVFLADLENPALGSSSHSLVDIDEVRFRRGARAVDRNGRVLTLAFPDQRMSSDHGRLLRVDARWALDDPTSKNGTLVDGAATRRARLPQAALLELGRTFLLFEEAEVDAVPAYLATDVHADELPTRPPGMRTFAPALAHAFDRLSLIAPLQIPILLLGDTGTGKELLAVAVHALSGRRGELVAVNCGALPPSLVESELFGHRKGAFSGALADRRGFVRSADGGTLFLDEVGELPVESQAALLRVLQEHEVTPVGEDRALAVDLRVVAATLRDLDEDGAFRADLYARIAGHVITLPPLRERRVDLGLLLGSIATQQHVSPFQFDPPALRALVRYAWPRNIRELEQVLTTARGLAGHARIGLEHFPDHVRAPPVALPPPVLDESDHALRAQLVALFTQHHGNVAVVAEVLGKQRQQIYKWIKRLAIDVSAFRA